MHNCTMVSIDYDLLNLSMSMDDELKKALHNLRYNAITPFGFSMEGGKQVPTPPAKTYKPTDVISDDDWEKIKRTYRIRFAPLDIPIEWIGRHLDGYWDSWKAGYYPNSEKFLDTMDKVFSDFEELLKSRQKKSYTNIIYFDELFQKFQKIIEQITWDDSKDWDRTWDGRIYNDILKEQAIEIQTDIEVYFKKRIKHGLELTDEMKNFKGVETIMKEQQPKSPPPPPEPEPKEPPVQKGDGELASAHNLIKKLKKDKKALQNRKKKPTTEMEMVELINRNLKKNGKCNNEACGRELEVDGETIKAWIKEFGLTRYATNPKHRK